MTRGRGSKQRRAVGPTALGDILPAALRDLGMPSMRLTRRVADAWRASADPAWHADTRPLRLDGGVFVVGVRSAALRQELAQFHKNRLLSVLRAALPDVPLVELRFRLDAGGDSLAEKASGEGS